MSTGVLPLQFEIVLKRIPGEFLGHEELDTSDIPMIPLEELIGKCVWRIRVIHSNRLLMLQTPLTTPEDRVQLVDLMNKAAKMIQEVK
jgi:hypothetical protein